MLLLDVTIVNVASPDIQRSPGATFSDLQWVVDAYSLMLAALLLTTGSLPERVDLRSSRSGAAPRWSGVCPRMMRGLDTSKAGRT